MKQLEAIAGGCRVLVQTTQGQTHDGRLVEADDHGVILEPVKIDGTPIAGRGWVPAGQVAWVQIPPAEQETNHATL